MKDSSMTLKIPLDAKYLPNITAQVDLVGAATANEKTRAKWILKWLAGRHLRAAT
jgi:hypothetical protein